MYVLDTSVLIDVLRGSPAAAAWLADLAEVPLCSLLDALRWAPVDDTTSRRAGELGRRHRRSHRGLGVADLLVAATALVHDAELATGNVRYYPMFPALRPPYEH